MRVAIDITSLLKPRLSGIGVYERALIRSLAELDSESRYDLCYRLSRRRSREFLPPPPGPNFSFRWSIPVLSRFRFSGTDVYHGPDGRIPSVRGPAFVATIHDIASVISDGFSPAGFRRKKRGYYRHCIRKASAIITPSRSVKDDLVVHLGASADRIKVIPMAPNDGLGLVDPDQVQAVLRKYGVGGRYILTVGPLSIRKNTAALVRAFASARQQLGSDTWLVIIGRHVQPDETLRTISESGCADRIVSVQYVSDHELSAFYTGAHAFAFPSLYEGFGMPPIEAMTFGVPVVAADTASIPETVGDAALLIDPQDPNELSEALARVCDNEEERDRLVRAGHEHVKRFSWDRTVGETLDLYRSVANGH